MKINSGLRAENGVVKPKKKRNKSHFLKDALLHAKVRKVSRNYLSGKICMKLYRFSVSWAINFGRKDDNRYNILKHPLMAYGFKTDFEFSCVFSFVH